MTPYQIGLVRQSRDEFMTLPVPHKRPLDDRDLQALLDKEDLVEWSIDFPNKTISGFTRAGMMRLSELAKDLLDKRADRARLVSRRTLTKVIAKVATVQWQCRPAGELTGNELGKFWSEITAWFDSQDRVRTHYIPCTMSAWDMPSFTIGPVRFYSLRNFPVDAIGLQRDEVWPPNGGQISTLAQINLIKGIFRLAQMRNSGMIAEIDVPGRESQQSTLTADIAVDVALGIFQLLMPPKLFTRAARATARSAPVWWATLSRVDGAVAPSSHNDEPGRTMIPGGVATQLANNASLLASTGRRLNAYLAGSGALPTLDEAWCNAVYWYHEAVAEPLETVAVAKLETAIEVLFRSEKSTGSKERLLLGLEAFFDVDRNAPLGNSSVTADQFAASIVTARSRVLHGTWPTLHTELPDGKGGMHVSLDDAENLARLLLLSFSLALDDYAASGSAEDTVEPFLNWQRSRPRAATAAAAASTSTAASDPVTS